MSLTPALPGPDPHDAEDARLAAAYLAALAPLTTQQRDFVEAYLNDRCVAAAARAAGYAHAKQAGRKALASPAVARAVEAGTACASRLSRFDHVAALLHLQALALADYRDYRFDKDGEPVVEPGKEHVWRAVQNVRRRTTSNRDGSTTTEVSFSLPNRIEAARLWLQANGVLPAEPAETERHLTALVVGLTPADLMGPVRAIAHEPPVNGHLPDHS